MDISDLIQGAPDLLQGLKGLGLSSENIGELGREVGNQVGGGDGFDLGDLISSLDADSFVSKIDVAALASKVGISPEIASGAIALIAPKIAEFTGVGSVVGKLGGLAKGLFGKD